MISLGDGAARPADPAAQVRGDRWRFTVLSSRLLRLEWSDDGRFVDAATSVVVDRGFEVPHLEVVRDGDAVTIRTEHLELHHDGGPFTASGLSVRLHAAPDIHHGTWRFGQELPQSPTRGNLGGTARTLDDVDGACPLEPGVLSTYGFAVLDDSASVLVGPDGWVAPRPAGGRDLYLFAHGHDYQGALDDYFRLTGRPPLVPRYVLGNWWSRYWRYDQDGYLGLMDDFARQGVPFSVAVVDMDWHLTDVDPALGTGWTGYTWDPALFPDPRAFLDGLHERGLAVTLNLHPADGVRAHEAAYPAMARELGVDPASRAALPFDPTSREFVDAYLRHLHHPLEEQGVDFWWLDWQSGDVSRVPGLDPLRLLNQVHHEDSGRGGRRPLTFSRYAGPGSHRYPVGFSGDTIATWASLAFQPYFTATAANIGYHWWSHDVGGHMFGTTDPELLARWVQLGVLSPVNRLHSSASPFGSKEPALLEPRARAVVTAFLRLRHVLVPYLYTAAVASHEGGVALARPLYHEHPDAPQAYEHPNEYLLGPDLLVAPITAPADPRSRLGAVRTWLPEGTWTDLLTGTVHRGGRTTTLHRPLEQYPVLARAGAVLPLAADPLAPVGAGPDRLVLRVVPGDGRSWLVEDDGAAEPVVRRTLLEQRVDVREDGRLDLRVDVTTPDRPDGARPVTDLAFDLTGVADAESVEVVVDGVAVPVRVGRGDDDAATLLAPALRASVADVDLASDVTLRVTGARRTPADLAGRLEAVLRPAHVEVALKDRAWAAVGRTTGLDLVDELVALGLDRTVVEPLLELVTADAADPWDAAGWTAGRRAR